MTEKTLIVDIKKNALDDGPGIRTLIFFKGCPLSCVWCQNPEAKSPFMEIYFDKELCGECGKCLEVCDQIAIKFDYKYRIDRSICNLCGSCIDLCPNQALKFVGKKYTTEELMTIILKDKVFYDNSGGGLTLSGGESLYHIDFVHNLLKELKKEEIHVCIETCGFYNKNQFDDLILPYVDLIYFDLKLLDPNLHAHYCKVSNERIFENFEMLIKKNYIEVLPRIPLIPDITDTSENLRKLARYLKSLQIKKIGFLPYNPLWLSKPEKISIKPLYNHSEWISNKKKEQINLFFSDFDYHDF
ncbi:MAG: glycyl-radical enzyme activating protein [Candidatus Lokiarchaeota archaeon]|nr:glycyl-radical enzyme activating protein [Candidatus Lokiarchaeota archaeon]